MFEFRSLDTSLIDIKSVAEYDYSDPNNPSPMGPNKMVVNIDPGYALTQMQMDFTTLKNEFESLKFDMQELVQRERDEAKMREDYPALQDVYEQYQMVKDLLVNAKKPVDKDGSNS